MEEGVFLKVFSSPDPFSLVEILRLVTHVCRVTTVHGHEGVLHVQQSPTRIEWGMHNK